jgi:hypothetical protein
VRALGQTQAATGSRPFRGAVRSKSTLNWLNWLVSTTLLQMALLGGFQLEHSVGLVQSGTFRLTCAGIGTAAMGVARPGFGELAIRAHLLDRLRAQRGGLRVT